MSSYVDGVLLKDERVLHRGQLSLIPYAGWILLGVATAIIIVGVGILAWVFIKVRTTEIAITTKRVIVKSGFVRRSTVEINLAKVESIQVDQSLPGRLFNYGTVIISGAGNPVAPITDVGDPLEFRRRFMEATDKQQSTPESLRTNDKQV
jgi:uncharacterized membrane protein YdbT with pleckstrin-like domain